MCYFGLWGDPDAALTNYNDRKDDLHAGRIRKVDADAATVKTLTNAFLNLKQSLVKADELSPRTWEDYKDACDAVVSAFGKNRVLTDIRPEEFTRLRERLQDRYGPHRLAKTIQCVRSLFKFGFDAELIAVPMRFGPGFKRPSKKTMRLERAKGGPKVFTATEVRRVVGAASGQVRAMILLGINCGLGNSDVGNLPQTAIDLKCAMLDFPRPKTGVARRCPLWPETVAALREVIKSRPSPKDAADAELVFITKYGYSWAKSTRSNPLSAEMRKLLDELGINGHRNFYMLRHTFRTVADAAKDQPSADYIMGHEVAHMSSVYRETISDERLKAVSDHVRRWLFPDADPSIQPERKGEVSGITAEKV
jgi:integrase